MSSRQGELPFAADFEGGHPPVKYPRVTQPVATKFKAEFIAGYLFQFALVTKHGNYIDAFAGPQEERGESTAWAARRVLEEQPRNFGINDFYLFEQKPAQFRRLEALRKEHKNHRGRIHLKRGDSNVLVPELLASGSVKPNQAAFALLDQRAMECSWALVEELAEFRRGEGTKTEILYFLPVGWLHRTLSSASRKKAEKWWGGPSYQKLLGLRKPELGRVVAERFRDELGYSAAAPWDFYRREEGDTLEYTMIHATDHPRAPRLIHAAYNQLGYAREPAVEQAMLRELEDLCVEESPEDPKAAGASAWAQGLKERHCRYPPKSPQAKEWLEGFVEAQQRFFEERSVASRAQPGLRET